MFRAITKTCHLAWIPTQWLRFVQTAQRTRVRANNIGIYNACTILTYRRHARGLLCASIRVRLYVWKGKRVWRETECGVANVNQHYRYIHTSISNPFHVWHYHQQNTTVEAAWILPKPPYTVAWTRHDLRPALVTHQCFDVSTMCVLYGVGDPAKHSERELDDTTRTIWEKVRECSKHV